MRKILIGFTLHSFVLTSPLLAATAHAADNNMRPGLWQITTTSDLLLLVPHLPPDQMQAACCSLRHLLLLLIMGRLKLNLLKFCALSLSENFSKCANYAT